MRPLIIFSFPSLSYSRRAFFLYYIGPGNDGKLAMRPKRKIRDQSIFLKDAYLLGSKGPRF